MARLSSELNCMYKIWHAILVIWSIVKLFVLSIFKSNPREVTRDDGTFFRGTSFRSGGSQPPGSNIKGLPRNRGVMRMPMGGGG